VHWGQTATLSHRHRVISEVLQLGGQSLAGDGHLLLGGTPAFPAGHSDLLLRTVSAEAQVCLL